ncbi:hypothetical protein NDU88_003976 [Pleurodeles waltl]|uniref:Uncharacterized protein n=1 Tax=Pleurodeles waltl TaxID=8319 RepID=A0AAV7UEB9_PLEWA|nr:hypothetical protein NDU88_003976 [Pleurodeles waltl]
MAERQSFEEAEYCNEFPQEELGWNAGEDVLEVLDASIQHSINNALVAALRPITAQLQLYDKGQGRSTPSSSKTPGEFSEVGRKHKDKSKGCPHEDLFSSLTQMTTEDYEYCAAKSKSSCPNSNSKYDSDSFGPEVLKKNTPIIIHVRNEVIEISL